MNQSSFTLKLRALTILLLMTISSSLFSQSPDAVIYFDKDEYSLTHESKTALTNWMNENSSLKTFSVMLKGHTDSDADEDYNLTLSKNRSETVREFLIAGGFNVLNSQFLGEGIPAVMNDGENNMSLNRRVEIVVLDNPQEMFDAYCTEPKQRFSISESGYTKITGEQGTKVFIPSNVFVKKDGTPVDPEKVKIEMQEFYEMSDFVKNNLTTVSNGEILETGGTINLRAFADGEELTLRKNAFIDVYFPTKTPDDGMAAFSGIPDEAGAMNWTPIGTDLKLDVVDKEKLNAGDRVAFITTITQYDVSKEEFDAMKISERGENLFASVAWSDTTFVADKINYSTVTFRLSGLGWVNCDRFYQYKGPKTDLFVNVDQWTSPKIFMVFSDINAIIYAEKVYDGLVVFKNVPMGEEVSLVGILPAAENFNFGMTRFKIKDSEIDFALQFATKEQVDKALESLN